MIIKVDKRISFISLQKILEPKGFKLVPEDGDFLLVRSCNACQEHPVVVLDNVLYCANCYLQQQQEENL